MPWFAILFLPVVLLSVQRSNWPIQGVWIANLYWLIRAKDPLLFAMPISQLRLVYARLACACLVAGVASYLDPMGRLLHSHGDFRVVPALSALTVGLLLIAAGKLIAWHRLRRWPKRALVVVPFSFFVAALVISFNIALTNRVAAAPKQIGPALFPAIGLLLWLITVEAKESDYHPAVPAARLY